MRCSACGCTMLAELASSCHTCQTEQLCDACAEAHQKMLPRHLMCWVIPLNTPVLDTNLDRLERS